ncbi:MAG TPA: hypothetical protein QF589_09650, partial [Anaerolineales bacterium]|nr:hypothetical protein [Anaerolineales bacterium]
DCLSTASIVPVAQHLGNLIMNYYPELVFQSIIGMHIYNKKDGPCRCRNTHTTLTQTLSGQRRAEPDFTSSLSLTAEVFFVGLSEQKAYRNQRIIEKNPITRGCAPQPKESKLSVKAALGGEGGT